MIKIIVGTYYNESNCIDIEYGHTKVVADRHPLIFPSLVGPAKAINFSLGKKIHLAMWWSVRVMSDNSAPVGS